MDEGQRSPIASGRCIVSPVDDVDARTVRKRTAHW